MKNIEDLKKLFKEKNLLEQALTHKSWVNENPGKRGTNERLEFLGDAILEFIVTDYLYRKLPNKEEGYLTALRANIVNTRNLANLAKRMKIGESIYLSKGESKTGRTNSSLLADTVEAIIGAIYIDQGLKEVSQFILDNLLSDLSKKLAEPLKDAKSRLQEYVQAKGLAAPKYKVVKITGPDHDREFTLQVASQVGPALSWEVMGEGVGKSKSEAEQKAAEVALNKVKG